MNTDFLKQVEIFNKLQQCLRWPLQRNFSNGTDLWIQKNGLAVWINEMESGIQIGYKNLTGGYSPLTGFTPSRTLTLSDRIQKWTENLGYTGNELRVSAIIGLIRKEAGL